MEITTVLALTAQCSPLHKSAVSLCPQCWACGRPRFLRFGNSQLREEFAVTWISELDDVEFV